MRNELTILNALRSTISGNINTGLAETIPDIDDDCIVLDFPSVEQMKGDTMIYIVPDYAEYQLLATTNDSSEFRVSVFLLCKRATQDTLKTRIYTYYNALYEAIRQNMDLGGEADFTELRNTEFYPAVEMNPNVQGAEVSVAIRYTKDF